MISLKEKDFSAQRSGGIALDSRLGIINDGVSVAGIIKKEVIQSNGALSSENGCQYRAPEPVLAIEKAVS